MGRRKVNSNIALIGFSATGKSVVARKVAEQLNWGFVDTDDEVVRISGKSIPEIFEQNGESEFRKLERKVLNQACARDKVVIATGGGAIIDPANQELLRRTSTIICLEAEPETIYRRLLQDSLCSSNPMVRPLLAVDNPLERIKRLKAQRQPYYSIADWTIHTDNLSLAEVSREVIEGWQIVSQSANNDSGFAEAGFTFQVRTSIDHYPVFVGWGLLERLGQRMKQVGLSGSAIIISDECVFSIYGEEVSKILEKAGLRVDCCVVPPGEATKNIGQAIKIYDFLIEHRVERSDTIVALGGGMVGDLAGFVAATFLRGLAWIQVPTSLMAMADASIGGKVAVDHPRGKNLIGAFYQPRLVLADVRTLTTLPQRELISGWAEVIKHALILDSNLVSFLEDNAEKLSKLAPNVTTRAIAWSASLKARVVAEDEKETGKRIILNYGHTIAHALEAATKYNQFLHGEAVAVGMTGEAKLSQRLGLLSHGVIERQRSLLQRFNLPVSCSGVDLPDVLAAMELDKKVHSKALRWVLLEDIAKVVIRSDVPRQDVLAVLREVIKS